MNVLLGSLDFEVPLNLGIFVCILGYFNMKDLNPETPLNMLMSRTAYDMIPPSFKCRSANMIV